MSRRRVIVGFIVLSAVLFLARAKIPDVLLKPFALPRELLYSAKSKVFQSLKREDPQVQRLRQENKKLREQMLDYARLKADNEALRSQFAASGDFLPGKSLMAARIVGFRGDFQKPKTIILGVGSKNGVREGAGVILNKNLIGKVVSVSAGLCEVETLYNKNFSTLGQTLSSSSRGIVRGEEDFVVFDNVSITDTLDKTDTVVTTGDLDKNGVGIPGGLFVGKISLVGKSESKPFQNAKLEVFADYPSLSLVFVLGQ